MLPEIFSELIDLYFRDKKNNTIDHLLRFQGIFSPALEINKRNVAI